MENNSNVGSDVKEIKVEKNYSSIFVTENDTFDISIEFYSENGRLFVKGVDEDFNGEKNIDKITFTIKYPSQADVENISAAFRTYVGGGERAVFSDISKLETIRFIALIRKWSMNEVLSNEKIMSFNPKIIKSILSEIRLKIDMDGII